MATVKIHAELTKGSYFPGEVVRARIRFSRQESDPSKLLLGSGSVVDATAAPLVIDWAVVQAHAKGVVTGTSEVQTHGVDTETSEVQTHRGGGRRINFDFLRSKFLDVGE